MGTGERLQGLSRVKEMKKVPAGRGFDPWKAHLGLLTGAYRSEAPTLQRVVVGTLSSSVGWNRVENTLAAQVFSGRHFKECGIIRGVALNT